MYAAFPSELASENVVFEDGDVLGGGAARESPAPYIAPRKTHPRSSSSLSSEDRAVRLEGEGREAETYCDWSVQNGGTSSSAAWSMLNWMRSARSFTPVGTSTSSEMYLFTST